MATVVHLTPPLKATGLTVNFRLRRSVGDPHASVFTRTRIRRMHPPLSINMIRLLFPTRPPSLRLLPAAASDALGPLRVCARGTAAGGVGGGEDPAIFYLLLLSSPPTSFMLLCVNPAIFPNDANVLSAGDISVAFQQALQGERRVISCQGTRRGARHQPRLSSEQFERCGVQRASVLF